MTRLDWVGEYWIGEDSRRTALGELVATAGIDGRSPEVIEEMTDRVVAFARGLSWQPDPVMVAVPPAPDRGDHFVPVLAAAVASALGVDGEAVLARHHDGPRVRDLAPADRHAVVVAAGYEVIGAVSGRHVVLFDDVVLTGTTLDHLAGLLREAGAADVSAIVVCRTRQR